MVVGLSSLTTGDPKQAAKEFGSLWLFLYLWGPLCVLTVRALVHSRQITWKWRGAPYKTTILRNVGPKINIEVEGVPYKTTIQNRALDELPC